MDAPPPTRARALWPWVGFALALGLTLGSWVLVRNAERARIRAAFEAEVDARVDQILRRLIAEEQILRGAAEFASQKELLSRPDWRDYVLALELPRRYPGIRGLGFARWIPHGDRTRHEQQERKEGLPWYQVRPAGDLPPDPDGFSAVVFLEPMDGLNQRVLGLDVWAEPVRREALAKARDSGVVAATGRVRLLQEEGPDPQAGRILFAPVYRHGASLTSVAERRAALIGWTNAPLRMDDHFQGILGALPAGLRIQILEGGEDADPLYPSSFGLRQAIQRPWRGTRLIENRQVDASGRSWTIRFEADERFNSSLGGGAHWIFLIGGALVSLLIFLVLRSTLRMEVRAERLASERLDQLVSKEARWKVALEGMGDGMWDWDVLAGKVIYSTSWKSMLGYSDDEIGDTLQEWESRVHPQDLPAAVEEVRKHLAGETAVYQSEHRLRCKGGDYKWILDRGMVVRRTEDGWAARVIGTHTDLTERRNMEEVLRKAEKSESLGLMAAGIAHDFNNLFQALLGNLELAHMRSDPAARVLLDRAKVALDKASSLSHRLMEFSGGTFTSGKPISLNPLVREVAESWPHENNLDLQLTLTADLPTVIADPQQMRQVMGILIENACEAIGPGGGTVTVTSEQLPGLPKEERARGLWVEEIREGPLVRVSVSDTGGGASPDVMNRLFDPFFSTKAMGRGLGLPSALGLIRGNHAGLQVVDRPGEGMTFRLYLSFERRLRRRTGDAGAPIQRRGLAVLIADDEADLRKVVAQALRECHGCTVYEAADGVEAIEVFQVHREEIGLILLDSVMPRMKGPEAFDEIRRIRPGIAGILISGFSEEAGQDLASRHGFAGFLKKPFPFRDLSDLMADIQNRSAEDAGQPGNYS